MANVSSKVGKAYQKHGDTGSTLYNIWYGMICRTRGYGNRTEWKDNDIKVCDEWLVYNNFKLWTLSQNVDINLIGGKGKDRLSLDRIDNTADYSPDNCRWVTAKVQNRNKRNNVMVTIGEDTLCLTDMCKKYNIKRSTVTSRLRYGWDIITAITTPTKGVGSNQNTYKGVNSNGKCK